MGTIQLDYQMPVRFGLTYMGSDNREHHPVVIHRALLGSLERFMGILIEHYGGEFPFWLAPVQVRVLPVGESHREAAAALRERVDARRLPGRGRRARRDARQADPRGRAREDPVRRRLRRPRVGRRARRAGAGRRAVDALARRALERFRALVRRLLGFLVTSSPVLPASPSASRSGTASSPRESDSSEVQSSRRADEERSRCLQRFCRLRGGKRELGEEPLRPRRRRPTPGPRRSAQARGAHQRGDPRAARPPRGRERGTGRDHGYEGSARLRVPEGPRSRRGRGGCGSSSGSGHGLLEVPLRAGAAGEAGAQAPDFRFTSRRSSSGRRSERMTTRPRRGTSCAFSVSGPR